MIVLPSAFEWSENDYYVRPWEISADMFGGVSRSEHTQSAINKGYWYIATSSLLGPLGYLFLVNIIINWRAFMKKWIVLLVTSLLIFCLTSCDLFLSDPLIQKMIDYYSNDENYVILEGKIISLSKDLIEIKYSEGFDFSYNLETGYGEFMIIDFGEQNYDLQIGDTIVFSSAPKHFYNGQRLPIVSIEKNGITIMNFEEGKLRYINWIQNDFKSGVI